MKYKPRALAPRLHRLIATFPVVVVSGARQVGKSTLLDHELSWEKVVFDPATDIEGARADPDLFLNNRPGPLVLDEIQYAPELVAAIKRRVDRTGTPGQFVLTGSQQWAVLKTAGESLAGRVAFLDLEGFSLAESAEQIREDHWLARYLEDPARFVAGGVKRLSLRRTLYEQLWTGSLPFADSLDPELIGEFYRSYLRTYIERDVRLLSDVGDWQQFGRFVQLAAALSAQEVNYSQVGREIGITPQTARRWMAMLMATFQWHEVPGYHGNAIKRISGRAKGYFVDTGLACGLHRISSPAALGGHPLVGALFESAVVAEIRKLAATLATPPVLHHWRSHGGGEVDLLLERDGRLHPIEIKLTTNPTRRDARGITTFRETYPHLNVAPGLIVTPVDSLRPVNGMDVAMPWDAC